MDEQEKPSIMRRLRNFYNESMRVLRITKKPDKFEYTTIVKISGLGIAAIGLLGFIITLMKELITKFL